MRIDVLGPIRAVRNGEIVDLGTPKQRKVLAALALDPGRPVDVDRLMDLVWGDDVPAAARSSLQAYIAGLRKILEPERANRSGADVLVTSVHGYALQVRSEQVDAHAFSADVDRYAAMLAASPSFQYGVPTGLDEQTLRDVVAGLDASLDRWRGDPFADLRDHPAVEPTIVRLDGLRTAARLDRARARLALGDTTRAATELAEVVSVHPLHEEAALLLVLALARSGRQSEALRAIRRLSDTLRDELGIDPDPAIDELNLAVLRQDPDVVGIKRAAGRPKAVVGEAPGRPKAVVGEASVPAGRPGDVMVGRDSELSTLVQLLSAANSQRPQFALVVGDAGIGKSRLLRALTDHAAERGAVVLSARCSADQGAPPLWPWVAMMRSLDVGDPDTVADLLARLEGRSGADIADAPDTARFQLWDEVRRLLADVATRRPTMLILDDLHWADEATLRLLQHVIGQVEGARLIVVASTRPLVEPSDALAAVAEAVARREGSRLDLTGLDVDAVAKVLGDTDVGAHGATELHARTGGNPFYVVELARHLDGVAGTTAGTALPASVRDVVRRRVASLPAATQSVLAVAAVVGRVASLDVLANAVGMDDDELFECLQPAIAARLVHEDVDHVGYAHAIVRDAVYDAIPTRRRAKLHGEIAATLHTVQPVGDSSGRAEMAWHLLRSGRAMAPAAWRAALAAAVDARSVHAYAEAAHLLVAAAAAQKADPHATSAERFAVLQAQGEAFRDAADLPSMRRALDAAIVVARSVDDVEALVMAADAGTSSFLWYATPYGEVHDLVVEALRHALPRLDPAALELRCRAMLALAVELYWAPAVDEVDQLVDEGLALARRIGDPNLLATAIQQASLAIWRPARADFRWALANELVPVAEASGSADAVIGAHTLLAIVAQELGSLDTMSAEIEHTRRLIGERAATLPLFILANIELSWRIMSGEHEQADRTLKDMERLIASSAIPQAEDGVQAAYAVSTLWRGADDLLIEALKAAAPEERMSHLLTVLLARAGRVDEAAAFVDEIDISALPDRYDAMWHLALAAEAAGTLGRPRLGREAYDRLAPFAGRPAVAGVAVCLGPVDLYLAFAALAFGDVALAARHADEAESLCQQWGIGLVGEWLRVRRSQLGIER